MGEWRLVKGSDFRVFFTRSSCGICSGGGSRETDLEFVPATSSISDDHARKLAGEFVDFFRRNELPARAVFV